MFDVAVDVSSASELHWALVHVKRRPAPKLGQTHFEGKENIRGAESIEKCTS